MPSRSEFSERVGLGAGGEENVFTVPTRRWHSAHITSGHPYTPGREGGVVMVPVCRGGKLKSREVRHLALGHTAKRPWSQDSNPVLSDSSVLFLVPGTASQGWEETRALLILTIQCFTHFPALNLHTNARTQGLCLAHFSR